MGPGRVSRRRSCGDVGPSQEAHHLNRWSHEHFEYKNLRAYTSGVEAASDFLHDSR